MDRLPPLGANRPASPDAPPGPSPRPSSSGACESVYRSLMDRQIRPRKAIRYSHSEWTSDGETSCSGVLKMNESGTSSSSVPLALSFTKRRGNGHFLGVVDEDGYVSIFNTNRCLPRMVDDLAKTEEVRAARWLAHRNAIFDICWIKEDAQLMTASADQTIRVWDVETHLQVGVMKGHTGSVKSLCPNPSQTELFVSASRDGSVCFWDLRAPVQTLADGVTYEPVEKINSAHIGSTPKFRPRHGYARSVTSALYLHDERMVATAGANDGIIKYWDTRKLKSPAAESSPEGTENDHPSRRPDRNRPHGIAGLSLNLYGTRLIAACVDSTIYMYDVMQPAREALKRFSGHFVDTFYTKAEFSPDGSHILSASADHKVYLWKVDGPENNPATVEGHSEEVSAVTWCAADSGTKIASCSDDYTVRVWQMEGPKFVSRARAQSIEPGRRRPIDVGRELPVCPSSASRTEQGSLRGAPASQSEDFTIETADSIPQVEGHQCNQTTPPSRALKLRTSSLAERHSQNARKCDQDSPQRKSASRSPSSVLSPPGSISKRRKTIVDYFGLRAPQSSGTSANDAL